MRHCGSTLNVDCLPIASLAASTLWAVVSSRTPSFLFCSIADGIKNETSPWWRTTLTASGGRAPWLLTHRKESGTSGQDRPLHARCGPPGSNASGLL
ncbi:hypothetical protein CEP53_004515 [Fusarium sp. AF-6]|nr:hypothetical protein CEP53_004515 [Fusarium sp. AF-6]